MEFCPRHSAQNTQAKPLSATERPDEYGRALHELARSFRCAGGSGFSSPIRTNDLPHYELRYSNNYTQHKQALPI